MYCTHSCRNGDSASGRITGDTRQSRCSWCSGRDAQYPLPGLPLLQTFDELLLLKRGGSVIFNGRLGAQSSDMIAYFQQLPGVPAIADGYSAHQPPLPAFLLEFMSVPW